MCGIAGVLSLTGDPVDGAVVDRMVEALAHRGPDGRAVSTATRPSRWGISD